MKKRYTLQILCLLIGTLIIVWLLPRHSASTYIYQVNRPWNYQLLTAPFDIPIRPDSLTTEAAIDSINRTFIPVYKRLVSVDEAVRTRLARELGEVEGVSTTTRSRLTQKVKEVYSAGIVDEEVYNDISQGRLKAVRVASGNVLTKKSTDRLRSPRKAYEWLKEQLPGDEAHRAIEQSKIATMLTPNVVLDTIVSERMRADLCQKATAPIGVIQQGERIIDRGEVVTLQLYTTLQTYETMLAERGNGTGGSSVYAWLAKVLYVGILMALLGIFMLIFRPRLFRQPIVVAYLTGLVVAFSIFAFLMSSSFDMGLYIVPFSMVAIMIIVFFDGRTAMFTTLITTLIAGSIAHFPLEFLSMQFVGASIAINSLKEMSRRSQLLRTAALVFIGYSLTYLAVNVMLTGDLSSLSPRMLGMLAINVVFVSFAYVLIFVFERLLGFTSTVGLVELSDINHPILRELSKECPGTFQHAMAVSNLAAEAAVKVGANVQLIRAGALYHDIGKIENPAFFTENQHGVNPHDALDPQQSARIITAHVSDGLRRADKAKLPSAIRKFIAEHHGTGLTRYFYVTYCNQHPGEEVDTTPFRYPGPNPSTIESSILMMADSVEAASRSLKNYSPEAITELVNKVIDGQVAEGLHNDSPLAFRDIKIIKDCFVKRLLTIYHSRIAYPEKK
ncbi:MAG: HDIG domain-containing protein [Bacteroides sp.]|nr:HDIG domain-containing protein [Bacteroides sp.]MCM1379113.1 HDIG domain-containing protein [Bacteroides sp.]MCM1445811.1 HDIG domain-containing protein [Prevotella sp.]